MSATEFVGIIPGVIDDQARDAGLSGGATGIYRLLIEHADRHTGELFPITVAELADLSRFGRKAVRRYLDELEEAELAVVDLHQGHDGRIALPRHGEVIYEGRSRQSTRRSRQSTLGSRRSTHRSRQSTRRSRQSTRANRENEDREREEDRRSSISSPIGVRDDSADAPPPAPAGNDASPANSQDDDGTDVDSAPFLGCGRCGSPNHRQGNCPDRHAELEDDAAERGPANHTRPHDESDACTPSEARQHVEAIRKQLAAKEAQLPPDERLRRILARPNARKRRTGSRPPTPTLGAVPRNPTTRGEP